MFVLIGLRLLDRGQKRSLYERLMKDLITNRMAEYIYIISKSGCRTYHNWSTTVLLL